MQVKTKTMGTVEVAEERLINIPSGLFGFEEYTDFALVDSEYEPLIWFQSLQEPNLAFLLIDPFIIADDYEADIDDSELLRIGIKDPADVSVFTIVTVPGDGGPVTANFQGPLIINKKNHLCMQAILDGSKYTTKHNIIEALRRKEAK
ncbi:flagellar assembly protein FliW [Treponema sp.]|uniref:flagellar assembly protein FliW n=1 Tax=Treponema sp. TaxID=166 RepID=UPI001D5EA553|nr:flagellar assembly protein FliW [Treponema sp.]MBS7241780.1 flagellar assembly protein FliW [Treponema sp.]MCI6441679.1 flagellar assembly protein FliW [Spirochaetia bacterium]MDY4132994.1 flagellar assembly protein FliW [Treponema sp.]